MELANSAHKNLSSPRLLLSPRERTKVRDAHKRSLIFLTFVRWLLAWCFGSTGVEPVGHIQG